MSDHAPPENDISGPSYDANSTIYHPVANIFVCAFQWSPKKGVKEYFESDYRYNRIENKVKYGAQFGNWKLVGETTTDSKGRYALEGVLTPGHATFVEAISAWRPIGPMLPTTAIIAALDRDDCDSNNIHNTCYGLDEISGSCPEGLVCSKYKYRKGERENRRIDEDGYVYTDSGEDEVFGPISHRWYRYKQNSNKTNGSYKYDDEWVYGYRYHVQSKLTKDDRMIYAFRKTLSRVLLSISVPEPVNEDNKKV